MDEVDGMAGNEDRGGVAVSRHALYYSFSLQVTPTLRDMAQSFIIPVLKGRPFFISLVKPHLLIILIIKPHPLIISPC